MMVLYTAGRRQWGLLVRKCGAIWSVFGDNNNNNDIDVCFIEVANEVRLLELMSGGNK